MFQKHVDQPGLEGHDPVPLGLVHPIAALLVDVALIRGDGKVGDLAAYGISCGRSSGKTFITVCYRASNFPLVQSGIESTL